MEHQNNPINCFHFRRSPTVWFTFFPSWHPNKFPGNCRLRIVRHIGASDFQTVCHCDSEQNIEICSPRRTETIYGEHRNILMLLTFTTSNREAAVHCPFTKSLTFSKWPRQWIQPITAKLPRDIQCVYLISFYNVSTLQFFNALLVT